MKFDVLSEPWIPVRGKEGQEVELGIIDTLLQAAELSEITSALPQIEYGIYRFLFTFLMDIYRPETVDDIQEIHDNGKIDKNLLEEYLRTCKMEGVSFDLFDADRPFLQSPKSDWKAGSETKSVAYLRPDLPSGNNHIHFEHGKDENAFLAPNEAIRALCALSLFCTAGVQGYPSGVNGAPPIYTIVRGKNLFDTLVDGMVPQSEFENYCNPVPYWRWNGHVQEKEKVAKTSLLFGMMFPARKVTLIPEEDGKVHQILFAQGLNFSGYDSWNDPYVTYVYSDQGRRSLKPNPDKAEWRNIGTLYDKNQGASLVVKEYIELYDPAYTEIKTYSTATSNATYISEGAATFRMPASIINSSIRMNVLQNSISETDNAYRSLRNAMLSLQKILKKDGTGGAMYSEMTATIRYYYDACRTAFFEKLLPELSDVEKTESDTFQQWKLMVRKIAYQQFDDYTVRLNLNGYGLVKAADIRTKMMVSSKTKEGRR